MERAIFFIMTLLISSHAFAYGKPSHSRIAKQTLNSSTIDNEHTPTSQVDLRTFYRDTLMINLSDSFFYNGDAKTGEAWVSQGSEDEDNGYRPLNNFYDPVYDDSLSSGMNRRYNFPNLSNSNKTPDWALEDTADIANQDLSLKDAQDYLYAALTSGSINCKQENV